MATYEVKNAFRSIKDGKAYNPGDEFTTDNPASYLKADVLFPEPLKGKASSKADDAKADAAVDPTTTVVAPVTRAASAKKNKS